MAAPLAEAAEASLAPAQDDGASLFERPAILHLLHAEVMPRLRSYPLPRIWLAECGGIEDVLALTVLLEEHRLREKSEIFVTACEEGRLAQLRAATVPPRRLSLCAAACAAAGVRCAPAQPGQVAAAGLAHADGIVWGQHCLLGDASFNEFELILGPAVLDGYTPDARRRALGLFAASLPPLGMLCMTTPQPQGCTTRFAPLGPSSQLYRRIG